LPKIVKELFVRICAAIAQIGGQNITASPAASTISRSFSQTYDEACCLPRLRILTAREPKNVIAVSQTLTIVGI